MTLGKNSTSCLDDLWEYCPLFHVCRPYWKPVVAPGNKQIHFLLARLHSVSFSLFLIYPPSWIQLLPIATRILFPVCMGLICESSMVAFILSIYTLQFVAPGNKYLDASMNLSNSEALVTSSVVLSDNLSLRSHLAFISIYILFILLKFVSNSSPLESRGVMSGSR